MNEQTKEDVLAVACLCGGVWIKFISNEFEGDRRRFLRACRIYWDNSNDLKQVAWFLKQGVEYVSISKEELKKSMVALTNKCVPQSARDEIVRQFDELQKQKIAAISERGKTKTARPTNVYLMVNPKNGLYKIGKSNNPTKRESTLRSEEPEIKLLYWWPGTHHDEQRLHAKYERYRVRGEWFKLDADQVKELLSIMEANV